ncbi:MAG TPA: hypothetical protein VFX79_00055 [Candidatus Saccharimonadales bacterium]|nr:hypothetical protein [Candidatus Saccharimonadales bacterium]
MDKRNITKFFKNSNGRVVIVQWPNAFVLIWAGLSMLSKVANDEISANIALLATISLLIWAYLEIKNGESPFRRVLGAIVLIFIVIGIIKSF